MTATETRSKTNAEIFAERTKISCGDRVSDLITRYKGIVTSMQLWDNGVCKISVQSEELKDGKVQEAEIFDVEDVELLDKGAVPAEQLSNLEKFTFGDHVCDPHSQYEGIVKTIRISRSGCTQYGVYPAGLRKDEQGVTRPKDGYLHLANELELVEQPKSHVQPGKTGPAKTGHTVVR